MSSVSHLPQGVHYFAQGSSLPVSLTKEVETGTAMLWVQSTQERPLELDAFAGPLTILVDSGAAVTMYEERSERAHMTIRVMEGGSCLLASRLAAGEHEYVVELEEGARSVCSFALFGGAHHSFRSAANGVRASSDVSALLMANGESECSVRVENGFLSPNGRGEIFIRALGEDQSRLSIAGKILIGLHGGGTDAYLTQEVLLLDATAKVDAIPGLEIRTNDVKASHSASVSRLTPEDLFYLASRGLDERLARELFLTGFLGAVAERAGDGRLTAKIMEWITEVNG